MLPYEAEDYAENLISQVRKKDEKIAQRDFDMAKWLIFSLKQAIIKSNCLNKIPVSNSSFTVLYNMLKYRCSRIQS